MQVKTEILVSNKLLVRESSLMILGFGYLMRRSADNMFFYCADLHHAGIPVTPLRGREAANLFHLPLADSLHFHENIGKIYKMNI